MFRDARVLAFSIFAVLIDAMTFVSLCVGAKNPIGLPIVELAVLRLLASDHGQPYINVAQVPSHRLSKPSCDAGRDHRAPSSTDRAAAYSKDKAAHPRVGPIAVFGFGSHACGRVGVLP